jgi:hypothetical protein
MRAATLRSDRSVSNIQPALSMIAARVGDEAAGTIAETNAGTIAETINGRPAGPRSRTRVPGRRHAAQDGAAARPKNAVKPH